MSYSRTAGIPNLSTSVGAVVLNATVTDTTSPGYLTIFYPGNGPTLAGASNLNWAAGQTVPTWRYHSSTRA